MKLRWQRRALFFSDEREQSDEACPEDGFADSALEQGGCAGSATGKNSTFAVDESSECFQVFVVDIDWTEHAATAERAAHFLLLQTSPAFAKFFQVSTRNCGHVSVVHLVQRNKKAGIRPP